MTGEKAASGTLHDILKVATQEFKEKGFQGASLREIVRKAGVTTGAFYGYYNSKEELFDALVKDFAENILNSLSESNKKFKAVQSTDQQKKLHGFMKDYMADYVSYMMAHKTELELLSKCAAGTKYENFMERLAAHEEESTRDFIRVLEKENPQMEKIEEQTVKIISNSLIHAIVEPAINGSPYETAINTITQVQKFFEYGWSSLFFGK